MGKQSNSITFATNGVSVTTKNVAVYTALTLRAVTVQNSVQAPATRVNLHGLIALVSPEERGMQSSGSVLNNEGFPSTDHPQSTQGGEYLLSFLFAR